MPSRSYLLSLPERLVRSVLGLGAGVVREVGKAVLPEGVRRGQLYQNLVDTTLRFLIERVGGAEGTYPRDQQVPEDFLARRAAGNVVEVLGIVSGLSAPPYDLPGTPTMYQNSPATAAASVSQKSMRDDGNA